MSDYRDCLLEIATEELPPGALSTLPAALQANIAQQLEQAQLSYADIQTFATPRRIAVHIRQLALHQPDRTVTRRGPAYQAAFTDDGQPTPAAKGFAKSCGVSVDQLSTQHNEQGKWLWFEQLQPGQSTHELLPAICQQALAKLPLAKPMRWGDHNTAFARPIHSVILLLGEEVIDCELYHLPTGRVTCGHRFLHPAPVTITRPEDYETQLRQANVIADFSKRRQTIEKQIEELCQQHDIVAQLDDALLNEVTNIVEWPVACLAQFDREFLQVPNECLIAAMQDHQKSFAVRDHAGELLARFIFIANIESQNPAQMIAGNEKVMRARLADAAFFYTTDKKQTLASRVEATRDVVFQAKLGSLFDKSQRLERLSEWLAPTVGADPQEARRAATLAKCDLMTDMVGEFPELQGVMGDYYARQDGESSAVATALREQYLPRFAGDALPESPVGITLALAERFDTLIGIFGIDQPPTGEKDPFKLRRAALGIIRIVMTHELTLDLPAVLQQAYAGYTTLGNDKAVAQVHEFIIDRAKTWLHKEFGHTLDTIQAVLASESNDLLDIYRRIDAVREFCQLAGAQSLAAANKRVSNILAKQAHGEVPPDFNAEHFIEAAEIHLADQLQEKAERIKPLCANRQYTQALTELAQLQQPIDDFFDHVMVMVDEAHIRQNRLALLQQLRHLFWQIADISLLQL
jgi:glycyl-tRNA synthetase beta chain